MSAGRLRVALAPGGRDVAALHDGLRAAGHQVRLVARPAFEPAERLLRRRGFTGPLTSIPATAVALTAGSADLVHAFSASDAVAARVRRRARRGPVVFTCTEVLDRARMSDRRLRLRLLTAALENSDAVLAAGEDEQDALWRWAALEVPVVRLGDVTAHVAVYRRLTGAA